MCATASRTSACSPTEVAHDDFRDVPADRLLRGLRGKQVVIVFVESYGRVALEQPTIAPEVGSHPRLR